MSKPTLNTTDQMPKKATTPAKQFLFQQSDRSYEKVAKAELYLWQAHMQKPPTLINKMAKGLQERINRIIPEKIHQAITVAIKQMVRSIVFGAAFTTRKPLLDASLQEREALVKKKIAMYKKIAATEGGVAGAGGFWFAVADFPAFLSIKMKMLYEIAALYGYDVNDYRERLYLLRIFQLAFSSQKQRNTVFQQIRNWNEESRHLPDNVQTFDWRAFQLEYRDYLDLAKLAQMIPGIGAVVGLTVNYRMTNQLGKTAMNAYRMRWNFSDNIAQTDGSIKLS